MEDCVFCKIVNGDLPNHTVYEDDDVLAFMDISPITEGHVVVISKNHSEQVWDLDSTDYKAMMLAAKKIAVHIRATLGCFRVGMLVEGLEVPHAHANLVPLEFGIKKTLDEKKISEPDHAALAQIAKKLMLDN